MKKLLFLAVIALVFNACGGGGGDNPPPPPPPPENKAPNTPSLVYPKNNELCIDNAVPFSWNAATDPDGDAVTYTFQVAEDQGFAQIVHTINSSNTTHTLSLEKGVAYYWRIQAKDSKGATSAYSTANQFYTEGEGETNHLPFAPVLGGPALSSVVSGTSTTLSWTASDVDTSDTLTFDVYFSAGDTPTELLAENISETSIEVTGLTASTGYTWKVVVKDNHGGTTIGQVWNFTTD